MISRHTRAAALRRSGYTLLEMTLALAISLIILGAVYEFLNRQTLMAENGRDLIEEGELARNILNTMAADIAGCLGGVDPKQLPSPSTDQTDPTLQASGVYTPLFNNGVEGSDSVLILSTSRVPGELLASDKRQIDSSQLKRASDLRRIAYWYVEDGANVGLARQELFAVTSGDFDVKPPESTEISKDAGYFNVIPNVTAVTFQYFDGGAWQDGWNSNTFSTFDGATPMGPPAAIRIILTIKNRNGETRDVRRTVALPAGNNFAPQLPQ